MERFDNIEFEKSSPDRKDGIHRNKAVTFTDMLDIYKSIS